VSKLGKWDVEACRSVEAKCRSGSLRDFCFAQTMSKLSKRGGETCRSRCRRDVEVHELRYASAKVSVSVSRTPRTVRTRRPGSGRLRPIQPTGSGRGSLERPRVRTGLVNIADGVIGGAALGRCGAPLLRSPLTHCGQTRSCPVAPWSRAKPLFSLHGPVVQLFLSLSVKALCGALYPARRFYR